MLSKKSYILPPRLARTDEAVQKQQWLSAPRNLEVDPGAVNGDKTLFDTNTSCCHSQRPPLEKIDRPSGGAGIVAKTMLQDCYTLYEGKLSEKFEGIERWCLQFGFLPVHPV